MDSQYSAAYRTAFEAVNKAANVEGAVVAIRDAYGIDHVTYHLSRTIGGNVDAPYVKSTYSAEWLTRYLLKDYIRIDPVVKQGFNAVLPFDWRELTVTREAMEILIDFQAHGLGGNGYSIPVIDKVARRALFTVTSKMADDEWTQFIAENGIGLAELGHRIHRMAIVENYGDKDPVPDLSPRELECLVWSAQGKDVKAVAIILGISEHTVKDYLKTVRLKLDCATTTQAVTEAIRLRLINP